MVTLFSHVCVDQRMHIHVAAELPTASDTHKNNRIAHANNLKNVLYVDVLCVRVCVCGRVRNKGISFGINFLTYVLCVCVFVSVNSLI